MAWCMPSTALVTPVVARVARLLRARRSEPCLRFAFAMKLPCSRSRTKQPAAAPCERVCCELRVTRFPRTYFLTGDDVWANAEVVGIAGFGKRGLPRLARRFDPGNLSPMNTRLSFLALGLIALSFACGNALQLAKSNGAERLKCPYDQVTVTSLGGDNYRADGCGKSELLTCHARTQGASYSSGCDKPDAGGGK